MVSLGGEQGWRTGESARLPPMCPGFDSCNLYVTLIAVLIKSLKQCCVNVFRFIWEGTPVQTSRTAQTPKTQECTRKRPLGQAPSRPTGTFAMFIKENTDVVMKENLGLDVATCWGVLKNLWEECGLPTKWLMKEKADKKYKEEVEKEKREMESLQPLQTDKQAFNRLDWGQIQTKEWMCRRISVFENYLCFFIVNSISYWNWCRFLRYTVPLWLHKKKDYKGLKRIRWRIMKTANCLPFLALKKQEQIRR